MRASKYSTNELANGLIAIASYEEGKAATECLRESANELRRLGLIESRCKLAVARSPLIDGPGIKRILDEVADLPL